MTEGLRVLSFGCLLKDDKGLVEKLLRVGSCKLLRKVW
jgi:hypothetical protein